MVSKLEDYAIRQAIKHIDAAVKELNATDDMPLGKEAGNIRNARAQAGDARGVLMAVIDQDFI